MPPGKSLKGLMLAVIAGNLMLAAYVFIGGLEGPVRPPPGATNDASMPARTNAPPAGEVRH